MLKNVGYPMPEPESYDMVSKDKIFAKMQEFQEENLNDEEIKEDFYELLTYFPFSICERQMTDNLKFLITLYYYWKCPQQSQLSDRTLRPDEGLELYHRNQREFELYLLDKVMKTMEEQGEQWYSYEQLSTIFRRSKASIFDAIKEKEKVVKEVISEVLLRGQAKKIALKQLIQEEKQKLIELKQNNQTVAQTTERT